MIAEDFGPVYTRARARTRSSERALGTESIGAPDAARGTTVEGARARAQACVYTGPKDPRGRG